MGKEEMEAWDYCASPSPLVPCWDPLSQRLGLRGHTLPELDLGLSVKQTALRSGTEQEDPSQHTGFAWFDFSIQGIFRMRRSQLNLGAYT